MIRNIFKRFARQQSGAVTVDWVVLTAAVVVLAAGIATFLGGENGGIISGLKDKITAGLSSSGITTGGGGGGN